MRRSGTKSTIFPLSLFLLWGFFCSAQEDDFTRQRSEMVKRQLAARDISDPRVLQAMQEVPRHLFIGKTFRHLAYADHPIPIGDQQTIS